MTLGEFKAWLEGLEEGSGGRTPTKDQWKRIKQKMGEVREPVSIIPAPFVVEPRRPYYEVTRPTWIVDHSSTVDRWPFSTVTCNNHTSSTFTIDGGESMAEVS